MALTPDFAEFEAGWAEGRNQLVYARLAADLDTPVSVMLKLTDAGRDAFILESVTGGEVRGRYSIIGMKPDLIWECRGADSRVNRTARYDRDAFSPARPRRWRRCAGSCPSPPSTCPPTCPPLPRGCSGISATT
jgi:anthranilate synthase component 1